MYKSHVYTKVYRRFLHHGIVLTFRKIRQVYVFPSYNLSVQCRFVSSETIVKVKRYLKTSTNRRSTCLDFLCFLIRKSITRWSKSSPPRWLSPLVATTSNTPWSIVKSDTSNVPPPKSNTRTDFSPPFLFSP